MPQNSNFRLPRGHRFFAKNGSYSYGAKSRWGLSRVHLGANGVLLDTKNGSKLWKFTLPQNLIFYHPAAIDFSKKIRNYGYGAKSRWRLSRVHLGANRIPMGPKNGSKPLEITMPQNSSFSLPHSHRFFAKNRRNGYGAKSRLAPSRVQLGPIGPIGSKKWVKTVKNYHAPKFEFLTTPWSSIFRKKWKLWLWRQITVGTP